jgi:V8-like Glu-specific endopeptidase
VYGSRMFFLFFLFLNAEAAQPTCSNLQHLYNRNQCCLGHQTIPNICAVGTSWNGQQCQITESQTRQQFKRPDTTFIGTSIAATGWHTCTCADATTYQCKSNRGDGAACCDRSMPAICGAGNVQMNDFKFNTDSLWHTCTCADGTSYECQSKFNAACCDRSMPALCGEGNLMTQQPQCKISECSSWNCAQWCQCHGGDFQGDCTNNNNCQCADGWHTCTCEDGSTYECKSKHGDGAACCDRSMPALCGDDARPSIVSSLDADIDAIIDPLQRTIDEKYRSAWQNCTCDDTTTYQCKSSQGDDCCTRSKPAICGAQPVWHTCACEDGTTYQCKSNQGDGPACCVRSVPALCGDGDGEDEGQEIYNSLGNMTNLRNRLSNNRFAIDPEKYNAQTPFPVPNLACGAGQIQCGHHASQINQPTCCKAVTASCLACEAGRNIEEYCLTHPDVQGCSVTQFFPIDLEDKALVYHQDTSLFGFNVSNIRDFEPKMHARGAGSVTTPRRLQQKFKLGGIVQPVDDRTEICSDANPYGKVVRIIYKDSSAVCTGTLVSPKHVLTAGHCLYNYDSETPANNGWLNIKGVLFTPCKNSAKMSTLDPPTPNSWRNSDVDREWTWARTVKGWTQQGKWQYDYGMIELSSVTNRGWMSFGYDDQLPKYSFNMNGFPGAGPQGKGDDDDLKLTDGSIVYWTGFELAHDYDKTYVIEDKLMAYYMDTWGGQSGSGVYAYFKNKKQRIIYGVHRGWDGVSPQDDTEYNVAKRITSHTFAQLCGWIDDTNVC